MKKLLLKSIFCLSLCAVTLSAQTQKQTYLKEADLWSIDLSVGARGVITETKYSDKANPWSAAASFSATRMLTPFSSARASLEYGGFGRYLADAQTGFAGGLDYLMNFTSLGTASHYLPVDIYGIVGTRVTVLDGAFFKGANFGLKVQYNISKPFAVYFEPMFIAYDDRMDGSTEGAASIFSDLRVGATYRFGNGYVGFDPREDVDMERIKMQNAKLESQIKTYKADKKGLSETSKKEYDLLKPLSTETKAHTAYYNAKPFDNTFLAVSVGGNLRVSRDLLSELMDSFTGNLAMQYGKWLTPIYAAQANVSWNWNNRGDAYGITTADFMINLNNYFTGTIDQNAFNFVPFAGVGMGYSFTEGDDTDVTPIVAAGLQLQIILSKRVRIYGEGRLNIGNMNHMSGVYTSGHFISGTLRAGLSVKMFSPTFSEYNYTEGANAKKYAERNSSLEKILASETERRAPKKKAKAAPVAKKAPAPVAKSEPVAEAAEPIVIKQRVQEITFVSPNLELDLLQRSRLIYAALWLKESSDHVLSVVAFNYDNSDAYAENRAQTIKDYLVKECGVSSEQVNIQKAKDAGYADKESANAVIIFSGIK